jgi:hypothetical protein
MKSVGMNNRKLVVICIPIGALLACAITLLTHFLYSTADANAPFFNGSTGSVKVSGDGILTNVAVAYGRGIELHALMKSLGDLPGDVHSIDLIRKKTPQALQEHYIVHLADAYDTNGPGRIPLSGGDWVLLMREVIGTRDTNSTSRGVR